MGRTAGCMRRTAGHIGPTAGHVGGTAAYIGGTGSHKGETACHIGETASYIRETASNVRETVSHVGETAGHLRRTASHNCRVECHFTTRDVVYSLTNNNIYIATILPKYIFSSHHSGLIILCRFWLTAPAYFSSTFCLSWSFFRLPRSCHSSSGTAPMALCCHPAHSPCTGSLLWLPPSPHRRPSTIADRCHTVPSQWPLPSLCLGPRAHKGCRLRHPHSSCSAHQLLLVGLGPGLPGPAARHPLLLVFAWVTGSDGSLC